MNSTLEYETKTDEIKFYEYWKIIVKRKNILFGIFFFSLMSAIITYFIIPRYYRSEVEVTISTQSKLTAENIVELFGNINDSEKNKIFINNSDKIKRVLISISKKSKDNINIIIDSKTTNVFPQAFKDIINHINNIPEIKNEIYRINAEIDRINDETDFKIRKLKEAKRANHVFLNQIRDMMMKNQITIINVNPADLMKKDMDFFIEISTLEQKKMDILKKRELSLKINAGIFDSFLITKKPYYNQIKKKMILTLIFSTIIIGLSIIYFLEYIEQMKMREKVK